MISFQVIIEPLRASAIFKPEAADDFFTKVFWNVGDILPYHQRMLASLFARQREQHPIIQSVSDIILESMSPNIIASFLFLTSGLPRYASMYANV